MAMTPIHGTLGFKSEPLTTMSTAEFLLAHRGVDWKDIPVGQVRAESKDEYEARQRKEAPGMQNVYPFKPPVTE